MHIDKTHKNCSTQIGMYHQCVNIGKEKEVWERWSKEGRYKERERKVVWNKVSIFWL